MANGGNNTVSVFAPGSTTPMATLAGWHDPHTLAIDPSGDLWGGCTAGVEEFAQGASTVSEYDGIGISSLASLGSLPHLRTLSIAYGQLSGTAASGQFPALQNVDLDDDRITDLSGLVGLHGLQTVSVADNPLGNNAYGASGVIAS